MRASARSSFIFWEGWQQRGAGGSQRGRVVPANRGTQLGVPPFPIPRGVSFVSRTCPPLRDLRVKKHFLPQKKSIDRAADSISCPCPPCDRRPSSPFSPPLCADTASIFIAQGQRYVLPNLGQRNVAPGATFLCPRFGGTYLCPSRMIEEKRYAARSNERISREQGRECTRKMIGEIVVRISPLIFRVHDSSGSGEMMRT